MVQRIVAAVQLKSFALAPIKFEYSEKATKFEKIFHLEFDETQSR